MKEKHEKDAQESRYGDELLSANWNPVIDLLHNPATNSAPLARNPERSLRDEDVDEFLGRIYTFGS